ncbi:N-acetylglucosamine-6-phosphate deacetylase [Edaphobacter aggregans]|uniref:N-acetylglucosamine-6-phosphate deacetylase n=1 Tax=Edaphobacter aggregans TaxID=570835 RepID=UPI0005509B09|nr:N-acetylglucosamine-6-phosphate deacetylase [Edaphobacter aggregans]
MLQTLSARRLLTSSATIDFPVLTIDGDGLIVSIEPGAAPASSDTTLTSTFFDIHTHGGASHDVMEATPEALGIVSRFIAAHGVGHYLPTTVTAPVDKTLASLEGIARAIDLASTTDWDARLARPVGIHLEGPFISHAKRGVHPEADILPPNISLFDRFQQAAGGHIRLITIAPEVPGSLDLIRHCTRNGVRVSIGHTNAASDEAHAAIEAGAQSATHTYNAMRPLNHREPGVLGTVLDSEMLFAELICDGVHVAPELVRLWLKAKGPQRAILVTDSMAAAGMPDGDYTLGTFAVRVAEGRAFAADDLTKGQHTLAGSVLTLDRAVANVQRFAGASLEVATGLASHNPAFLLGLERAIGYIAPGQPANFNVFTASGELQGTILGGAAVA